MIADVIVGAVAQDVNKSRPYISCGVAFGEAKRCRTTSATPSWLAQCAII